MKTNGTSFYAFPGASEDISTSRSNPNTNFYFSHFVLLNLPAQNLVSGSQSNPVTFDFDSAFYRLNAIGQQATTYKEQLVESLRNYVANHEVTIRDSRLNNTEFYYDSTVLDTTSEKIFFKWCKKLNLIQFEPATDGDEYFGNLVEFERNNLTDESYFPEHLWRERKINNYSLKTIADEGGYICLEFDTTLTNLKAGDTIVVRDLDDSSAFDGLMNDMQFSITEMIPSDNTYGHRAVLSQEWPGGSTEIVDTGYVNLMYHKLIQYIGNVNGVNSVQEANRSYQEVWAQVPAHTGQTPDILFRTMTDRNYKPNMFYPILPSQYQPEILGAELFNSPIVSSPQNYPGNFYGQFDSEFEYTYRTQDGDTVRRSGDYFGYSGDVNDPVVSSSNIDGLGIDFNPSHYVKMNIIGNEMSTFDQFNAMIVDNLPPKDFDFNAILWYYTLEDVNGLSSTNLYGISLLDNPDNNPIDSEVGLRIPTAKKLVATDDQDGTAYSFNLNLNYNIINENPQDTFNPAAINSLFSFGLFNDAMSRLALANDSFNKILGDQIDLKREISDIKQLVYTQGDLANINSKINNLEVLLRSYSTLQLSSSDTIEVVTTLPTDTAVFGGVELPSLRLNNIDPTYGSIYNLPTTTLYNASGIVTNEVLVPTNKNFLINVINNDTTRQVLPVNDRLTVLLSGDLGYKQSVDIVIDSTATATQNKQLEVYINFTNTTFPVVTKAIGPVDFPIYYNSTTQTSNLASTSQGIDIQINLNASLELSANYLLTVPTSNISSTILSNMVKKGETFKIENLVVGTSSVTDMSGQYTVDNVSGTSIVFDLSTNQTVTTYVNAETTGASIVLNTRLSNLPRLTLNKGSKYRITRVGASETESFQSRYLIQKL
jgi:hypothetical protein